METKNYQWIQKAFAKGVDPELAITEFQRIENVYGSLTAEILVQASAPEDALFHSLFTWDDTKAAHNWRIHEARTIINNIEINVVANGQAKQIPVYEIVTRPEGRVYKSVSEFTSDDIVTLRNQSVKSLNYWKSRLATYKDFEKMVKHIDEAINAVPN